MLCLYMVMQNSALKPEEESLIYFTGDYQNKKMPYKSRAT